MRIFSAVRHSRDPKHYYGGLWSSNFYPALHRLGHEIVESTTDLLPASRFMHVAKDFTPEELACRSDITEHVLSELRQAHSRRPVDLFLSYFYNAHFDPAGFEAVRRMGIPSVNFYCNSIYQFDLVAAIASSVDFSWHPEKHARDNYVRAGGVPIWVQMAADPVLYHPVPANTTIRKACFVGQRYADRDRLVAALLKAGVPIDIFGNGWSGHNGVCARPAAAENATEHETSHYLGRRITCPGSFSAYRSVICDNVAHHGIINGVARSWRQWLYSRQSARMLTLFAPHAKGHLPSVSLPEVFSRYGVVLNFSNVWLDGRPGAILIPHVRLRDFEAPMCGACYLTGHTDEITEFYDVGREIDTYSSEEELINKTRWYLTHPERARSMGAAAFNRARRDHTWDARFRQLFSIILRSL